MLRSDIRSNTKTQNRRYLENAASYEHFFKLEVANNFAENHFLLINFFCQTSPSIRFEVRKSAKKRVKLRYTKIAVAQKAKSEKIF